MAVKHLFSTEYVSQAGVRYKLDIHHLYANSSAGTPTSFDVSNISLDYQSSDLMPPLIGSSMRVSAYMSYAQRDAFFNATKTEYDNPVSCAFYEYKDDAFALIWCGLLVPEECSEIISDEPISIEMTFSDGIGTLALYDFVKENGDPYTDKVSIAKTIYRLLKRLPHIELYSSPDQVVFREIGTPTPSTGSANPWNPANPVFNNTFITSSTFSIAKQELQRERVLVQANPLEFRSCYEVLEDICIGMGLSCCMAEGRVTFFSRSYLAFVPNKSQIRYRDFAGSQESDFETPIDNQYYQSPLGIDEFLSGASKSFQYPIKGYSIVHEQYGSDIILGQISRRIGNSFNINGTSYATIYVVDGEEQITIEHVTGRNSPQNPPSRVDDILVSGDGENTIRIQNKIAVLMRSRGTYSFAPPFNYYTVGNTVVCRMIVELTDDTGRVYRLKRRVITIDEYSNGDPIALDITNGIDYFYKPKTYATYPGGGPATGEFGFTWVADNQVGFSTAFLECIVNDPAYQDEESPKAKCELFLTQDFPNGYFPVPTGCVPDQNGYSLNPKKGSEYNHFNFSMDHVFEVPNSGTNFVSFEVKERCVLVYSADQTPLAASNNYTSEVVPVFRSRINETYINTEVSVGPASDTPWEPEKVEVIGFIARIGEGGDEIEKTTIAFNTGGSEIIDGGSSRISARSYTTDNTRRGLLWANYNTFLGNIAGPTLDTTWAPEYDTDGFSVDLHHMVCSEAVKMRQKAREFLSATAINVPVIHPYRLFTTQSLSSGTETYLPFAIKFDMLKGHCSVDAMLIGFERGAILEVIDSGRISGNQGGQDGGPSEPGWGEAIDGKVLVQGQKVDLISITEAIDLDVVKTKTDFITVTEPVDLNDISAPDLGKLELFSIFIGKK
jgi:hypothetical protein